MSRLFSPWKLGALELENRIVIAPMCQHSDVDGNAQDWHLSHSQFRLWNAASKPLPSTIRRTTKRISKGFRVLRSSVASRSAI